jgi:azurin
MLRLLCLLLAAACVRAAEPSILDRSNLVAWCIVPFDAKKRTPAQRAEMVAKLGLKRVAYDWREQHVPEFEEEILQYQKHGIEFFAFWGTHEKAFALFEKYKLHPQIWLMAPNPDAASQEEKVKRAAEALLPVVEQTRKLGCKLALYNHGGWNGEPENMAAIAEYLRAHHAAEHVGIVYNQHHGHTHAADFAAKLKIMQPYLFALNLNGMIRDGEAKGQKIVPLAQGELDADLLRVILQSGWRGPVGILNHTDEDAEARLLDNLEGLDWLRKEIAKLGSAGAKPVPRSWKPPVARDSGAASPAFEGKVIESDTRFRRFPLTVECRAKLNNATGFNILVACDPKSSAAHWELYTYAGSGEFSAYLPGRGGEVRSAVNVCDGQWHTLGAVLEENRLRLYVDGREVKDAPLPPQKGDAQGSGIAFGRLVEGTIGCDGVLEAVRIRRGIHDLTKLTPLTQRDDSVMDIWQFTPAKPEPKAATFELNAAPLVPEHWPNRAHPVNRQRVYDFYLKQAQHFRNQSPGPELLASYPGLDGGVRGHWGNQNEETWRDGRLNEMDCGPCVAGVFRGAGLTIPKAICVRLGDDGDETVVFDPGTCHWRAIWKGGFLKFSDVRHGLMDGLRADTTTGVILWSIEDDTKRPAKLLGYYRHGKRTVFACEYGDQKLLCSMWAEGSELHSLTGESLRQFTKGGPSQWPQVLETQGTLGKPMAGWPYVVDTLTLPFDNPWKTLFFIGGHDFFSNGDIALCTMTGDVWRVSGVEASLSKLRWKRMAAGLHQPLGLVVVEDKVCVLGRDQITRLHDLNGDGEADFYECLTNDFETPTGGHDFMCGLERDAAGNFYTASGKDGLLRITPGRKAEVIASGFRNPDGLGLAPDGTLTVPYSEGEWTPTSAVAQITPGGFYGYPGPRAGLRTLPPLVWLPRGIDNSAGGQTWVPDGRWGPLRGQLIHTSYGAGTHMLILRQKIGEVWQGAAVPLPGDFNAGVHRARFSPHDGQLYLSGMCGWGTYTPHDGCLQRVRYTGGPVQVPLAFEARDNGVLLTFSEKLAGSAADAKQHFAQCWNYRYSPAYGSPELSLRHPATPGHDVLEITSAHVLRDGCALFLEIPQLQPAHTIHLALQPQPGVWRELFVTAHALALPFTEFPGYQVIAKTSWTAGTEATGTTSLPNPFTKGAAGRALRVEAAAGLQFATKELTARAGERLSLTFANPDVLPHNWVLLAPGSFDKVGDLTNKLIADPQGFSRHYVPDVPEVLAWTDMVNPGGEFTVHLDVPAKAGEYPFICTFPGHWMVMKGVLHVN